MFQHSLSQFREPEIIKATEDKQPSDTSHQGRSRTPRDSMRKDYCESIQIRDFERLMGPGWGSLPFSEDVVSSEGREMRTQMLGQCEKGTGTGGGSTGAGGPRKQVEER